MTRTIRLLLTQRCNARCDYCHNEGQDGKADQLTLSEITNLIGSLTRHGIEVDEFVLSGGEPTLHRDLADIAHLCKQSGARVSINTHGGHPDRLAKALPWIDEVKIHLDAFDEALQQASMGIQLRKVLQSIDHVQSHPHILCMLNHPLRTLSTTFAFLESAQARQLDCKIIGLHGEANAPHIEHLNLAQRGYRLQSDGSWVGKGHHVHTRQCDTADEDHQSLFVGVDGVRQQLTAAPLGRISDFTPAWLTHQAPQRKVVPIALA